MISKDKVDTDSTKQYDNIDSLKSAVTPKAEYIFLLDRSGSMSGKGIELGLKTLSLFMHSIPFGSKFNICSYGSTYSLLYQEIILRS